MINGRNNLDKYFSSHSAGILKNPHAKTPTSKVSYITKNTMPLIQLGNYASEILELIGVRYDSENPNPPRVFPSVSATLNDLEQLKNENLPTRVQTLESNWASSGLSLNDVNSSIHAAFKIRPNVSKINALAEGPIGNLTMEAQIFLADLAIDGILPGSNFGGGSDGNPLIGESLNILGGITTQQATGFAVNADSINTLADNESALTTLAGDQTVLSTLASHESRLSTLATGSIGQLSTTDQTNLSGLASQISALTTLATKTSGVVLARGSFVPSSGNTQITLPSGVTYLESKASIMATWQFSSAPGENPTFNHGPIVVEMEDTSSGTPSSQFTIHTNGTNTTDKIKWILTEDIV